MSTNEVRRPRDVELRPSVAEAADAYARSVRAHREQSDRMAGAPAAVDRWEGRAGNFRPGRMEAPEISWLVALLQLTDTLLDIGAGGGRYAVPLSAHAGHVIAVEPSPAMRKELGEAVETAGCTNITVVPIAWPPAQAASAPSGDVSLAANVLYGVEDVVPFIAAMERQTRRTCAVIAFDRAPSTPHPDLWAALHDEPFAELPALAELLAVLLAMGRRIDVRAVPPDPEPSRAPDEMRARMRSLYRVEADSEADRRLSALLASRPPDAPLLARRYSSVVSWPSERGG